MQKKFAEIFPIFTILDISYFGNFGNGGSGKWKFENYLKTFLFFYKEMKSLDELNEKIKDGEILHSILLDMLILAKRRNVINNFSYEKLLDIQTQHNENIHKLVMELSNLILYNKNK